MKYSLQVRYYKHDDDGDDVDAKRLRRKFNAQRISLVCNKSVTTQNLAFLSYWYRKKHLQMHFNRYSVITQLAKLTVGKQLCHLCTRRKL